MKNRPTVLTVVTVVVIVVMAVLVIYPLWRILLQSLDGESFQAIAGTFRAPWFSKVVIDTVGVVVASGAIAVAVGAGLAWANERTDARMGYISEVLPIVPFLMPNIALAIGWVFLAQPDIGFLNKYVFGALEALGIDVQFNIYSWGGLVFLYVLYFVPYSYLICTAALRNLDASYEEASMMSGASLTRTVRKVSLPLIRPQLLQTVLLVPIVLLALYGVPAIVAVPQNLDILSVRIIRAFTRTFPADTNQAIALSFLMVVLVGAAWIAQQRLTTSDSARIGGRGARSSRIALGRWKWLVRAVVFAYIALAALLPLIGTVIVALQPYWSEFIRPGDWTLRHFQEVFRSRITRDSVRNSFVLGAAGGAAAVLIAALFALYAQRAARIVRWGIDGVLKIPAVVPNIVFGVGFLLAFSGPPFRLAGTVLLLFLAFVVVFMPQASVSASSALHQVGSDLSEASAMCRASEGRTFRRVVLPLATPGLVSGWSIVFVLIAGNLSVAALLSGAGNPVMGFTILDAWEQGSFSRLAALCAVITIMTTTVVLAVMVLTRQSYLKK